MRYIPVFILIILITLCLLGAGCTSPATPATGRQITTITPAAPGATPEPAVDNKTVTVAETGMPSLLARIEGEVNLSLCSLDQNISVAARSLGDTGISGSAANSTLGGLAASPRVIDAVTVTTDGVIAAVMPARFQGAISTTVANQSHIIKGLATGAPVLSTVFAAVEGFNASAIVYPVRTTDGTLIGLVSVPFQPESLLSDAISPLVDARVYEVTVIQADGRVLYATNTSQVGMSSLNDPLFASRPDLTRFINRVASEDSGRGNYSVHDPATNTNMTVENYWTTVSLHGTPWRIVLDTVRE